MDINSIVELVSLAISGVALLVAIIRGRKKKEYTVEQLQAEAQAKMQKYLDKKCKKYNVEQTTSTESTEQSNYY